MDNHFHAGPSSHTHTETHISIRVSTTIHRTELVTQIKPRYDPRSACVPPWPLCDWLNNNRGVIFQTISHFSLLSSCRISMKDPGDIFLIIMDAEEEERRGEEEGHRELYFTSNQEEGKEKNNQLVFIQHLNLRPFYFSNVHIKYIKYASGFTVICVGFTNFTNALFCLTALHFIYQPSLVFLIYNGIKKMCLYILYDHLFSSAPSWIIWQQ